MPLARRTEPTRAGCSSLVFGLGVDAVERELHRRPDNSVTRTRERATAAPGPQRVLVCIGYRELAGLMGVEDRVEARSAVGDGPPHPVEVRLDGVLGLAERLGDGANRQSPQWKQSFETPKLVRRGTSK